MCSENGSGVVGFPIQHLTIYDWVHHSVAVGVKTSIIALMFQEKILIVMLRLDDRKHYGLRVKALRRWHGGVVWCTCPDSPCCCQLWMLICFDDPSLLFSFYCLLLLIMSLYYVILFLLIMKSIWVHTVQPQINILYFWFWALLLRYMYISDFSWTGC